MKNVIFRTSEVAEGGANVAVVNSGGAMVGDSISKHRRSATSQKGRRFFLRQVCSLLLALCVGFPACRDDEDGGKREFPTTELEKFGLTLPTPTDYKNNSANFVIWSDDLVESITVSFEGTGNTAIDVKEAFIDSGWTEGDVIIGSGTTGNTRIGTSYAKTGYIGVFWEEAGFIFSIVLQRV